MKAQLASLALCALIVVASGNDFSGYYGRFGDCYDDSEDMCAGTSSCSGSKSKSTTPAVSASSKVSTSDSGFTTVSAGYTPTPGECVCVSESTTVSAVKSSTGAPEQTTTVESGSSSMPGDVVLCPCRLVEYLYNLSVVLEGSVYYDIYIQWLIDIQITILGNSELTEAEKFQQCVFSFQFLFEQYVEIRYMLEYEVLVGFGYVCDLFTVVIQKKVELSITETLIVLEGESCALFDAFYNCTYLSSEQLSALEALFAEIRIEILSVSSYTYTDKCILMYEKFYAFFQAHAEWELDFSNVTIEGFGCFGQWLSICKTYYGLFSLEFSIGGSVSSCAYLQAIYAATQNESYSLAFRLQLKNFYNKISAQFATQTDVYARLDILMSITQEFSLIADWDIQLFYSIGFYYECRGVVVYKTCYELLFEAYFYKKYGFHCTIPVQDSTSSAVVSTTQAITASTGYPKTCDQTNGDAIMNPTGQQNSMCVLVSTFYSFQSSSSCDNSCKNYINPYLTKANNTVWSNYATKGWQSTAQSVFKIFSSLTSSYVKQMMTTVIKVNNVNWGRCCDFASCSGISSANLQCS